MVRKSKNNTDDKAPILIMSASKQPYLSMGIYSGGIKLNGHSYVYMPPNDCYLRNDYVKEYSKQKKEGKTFEQFIEFVKSIK